MTLRLNGEHETALWRAALVASIPTDRDAVRCADEAVLAYRDRVRVPDGERCTALGPQSNSRCVYGDGHNGAHLYEGGA